MTTKKDTGGPAFPGSTSIHQGMTLRDWFAGQALGKMEFRVSQQALLADRADTLAMYCYAIADAMIRARGEA